MPILGIIAIYRQEVRPFSDKQIALLQNFAAQVVIAMENARLLTETLEALEQQTATAEVLQVINSSPGDLAPVFDAMLEKAIRLCEAAFGTFWTYDGEFVHFAAARGHPRFDEWTRNVGPSRVNPGSTVERLLRGEPVVHIPDARDDEAYRSGNPRRRALVDVGGARSYVTVPLRKGDKLLGAFAIYRQEVRPFTDKQIALCQNFAAQAVVAMENARLITETREALEQQTATAEVLQVVSSSPGNLIPVFDAMLERAMVLCEASFGGFFIAEGGRVRAAATRGLPSRLDDFLRQGFTPVQSSVAFSGKLIHIADLTKEDLTGRAGLAAVMEHGGARTALVVPLRKESAVFGTITAYRQEVRPFAEKQIALLQSFAAQAVIAMENARLITETREALEQQTATAEVLQVINSSPGDLAPVFEAILEKAHSLCGAAAGSLGIYDGKTWRAVVQRGYGEPLASMLRQPARASDNPFLQELIDGVPFVHVADLAQLDHPIGHANVAAGVRTLLGVALRKDHALLGTISIARREPRPFSDKEIALLENFAAQAVIAMENARLLTETREALEQQTATAEVLQVINSSPGDLTPVFDAILEKAHTLCGAAHGSLQLYDGEKLHAVATHAVSDKFAEILREGYCAADSPASRALIEGQPFIQIADCTEIDHPVFRSAAGLSGIRTVLFVPLRRDDAFLGLISAARLEVRSFSDKQIALLQNFAAQAVIAMENARLLTETREALEQQTATAEVLQVINSSPGDLVPVFDAMLEKAMRLCEAAFGMLWTYDGERLNAVAMRGVPDEYTDFAREPLLPSPQTGLGRILHGESLVHIADIRDDEVYRSGDKLRVATVELGGARTLLVVPLRKEGALLGVFTIYRQEVRPFSDEHIALLQNFAAQAVIAMENARLLGKLRERTRDLEQSLEYQTATSDVLEVISRSTFDLQPVLDTLIGTAARLCQAEGGHIATRDGDVYRPVATFAYSPEHAAFARTLVFKADNTTVIGRTVLERTVTHVSDMQADPAYASAPGVVKSDGGRTVLGVPLLRQGEPIGAIGLGRRRVEPFTERQIELVRTFADQAVIAIENTRLLTELRESLEQQQAIAEILQVINFSSGNLTPVFDAILEKAMRLCEASFGQLSTYDGERFHTVATRGVPAAFADYRRSNPPNYGPGTAPARVLAGERVISIDDLKAEPAYQMGETNRRALVDLGGARSEAMVALTKDDVVLGFIEIYRQEVHPFSDKQVALLQNFAAQAVIAMDNARLLNEIRQRQAELRVTFDNMGDGVAMFDAELRLAAWNLNFQRILDLPEALLAERLSYPDYIRFLAERGEFGSADIEAELGRRLEAIGRELRFEHTRPDGRVIEVRRNGVPGGGFVVIYSDVTERKRAEAEIRAARDTAERALQELQTAQASLLHAQKMAALGQLTAGIAHEIKNPLNFVNNFAELSGELLLELKETTAPAVAALGDDERAAVDEVVEMLRGNLDKIAEHGKRADGIVKSMLEHSRGVSGERRVVDLNGLIDEALNLAYHGTRAQDASFNITLEREFDRGLAPIDLAPQEMTRVFLNLFGNGFYAAAKRQRDGAGPDFRPTLRVTTHDLGEMVEVRVRDNGSGIAPEIWDKLFQPFVTTKPTGEGTGLGLSIAYDIVVQQHGGTIDVDSVPGEFTEFTIRLPRRAPGDNSRGRGITP